MLQASLNGMLIDWERAGPERRFEVRVPNVLQAGKFYRGVFGADETFRQETHNGKVFRLGFTIGRIGFAISSEGDIERPCSLRPLRNLDPLLLRSYYVLKIQIVWLAPHSRPAADLQELIRWIPSQSLPIPSAVIGHWSSGSQFLNALDDFRSRSPVVERCSSKDGLRG